MVTRRLFSDLVCTSPIFLTLFYAFIFSLPSRTYHRNTSNSMSKLVFYCFMPEEYVHLQAVPSYTCLPSLILLAVRQFTEQRNKNVPFLHNFMYQNYSLSLTIHNHMLWFDACVFINFKSVMHVSHNFMLHMLCKFHKFKSFLFHLVAVLCCSLQLSIELLLKFLTWSNLHILYLTEERMNLYFSNLCLSAC